MPPKSSKPEETDPLEPIDRRGGRFDATLPKRIPDVTGVVLAGGSSRRYGQNKALVHFDGVPLIERVVSILQQVFERVIISANEPLSYRFLRLPMVQDVFSGVGPLAGVHAALAEIFDEVGFFVACDMPFLNPALIRHMVCLSSESDAVVPRVGPHIEPLHAVYRKSCINAVEEAIQRGERGIASFYPHIRIRYLEESEVRKFEPELDAFVNVNRPDELRISMKHLHDKRKK